MKKVRAPSRYFAMKEAAKLLPGNSHNRNVKVQPIEPTDINSNEGASTRKTQNIEIKVEPEVQVKIDRDDEDVGQQATPKVEPKREVKFEPVLPKKKRTKIVVAYDSYFGEKETDKGDHGIDRHKNLAKKAVTTTNSIAVKGAEPKNWRIMYDNIRTMRKTVDAAVDTQGCHMCYDPASPPKIQRFQILVALMMSSQTKDEVNHAACLRLRGRGLSPQMIIDMDPAELGSLIKPVGFWSKKTDYLKRASRILLDQYDGDIPDTLDGLTSLPGVGPKMGHLVMQIAWNKMTGIAVDTHVHRLCNRYNWVKSKDPKGTGQQLEAWFPHELWDDINPLLVGFGQTICTPLRPKCGSCLNRKICPSSTSNK